MDSIDDIADPSDFTLFGDVTTVPAEMKISQVTDKPTVIASSLNQSSKNKKTVQNNVRTYQNKSLHVRNNSKTSSPHCSQNDSLQMNHTIVKSTLTKGMLEQNPFLLESTEVKSGILLGVNQVLGTNNEINLMAESKAPQEVHSIGFWSKRGAEVTKRKKNNFIPGSKAPQEVRSTMFSSKCGAEVTKGKKINFIPESKAPQEVRSTGFSSKCGADVIKGKHFSLYPPKHPISVSLSSEQVPNCRTVWVVGLPKNFTDNIIHEIFERFGKIEKLLMKTRSSCRVRYISEESAGKAISFSGYTLVVRDSDNVDHSGLIFVDFSQSHNDVIAWKQTKISQKSKSPIKNCCTSTDINNVMKKFKSNIAFMETVQEITSWIIRGDCNKNNAGHFYDIIASAIASAKRLQNKKGKTKISAEINRISTFLGYFYQPSVWSYFTLPQRTKIDIWRVEIEEMKSACDNLKIIRDGVDEPSPKKMKLNENVQEKDDKLLHEIEAYKSENMVLKTSHKVEKDELNGRLETSSKSLMTSNYELMKLKIERNKMEAAKTKEIEELRNEIGTGLNKNLDLERKLEEMRFELDKIRTTKTKEIADVQKLNETLQEIIKEQENNNKEFNELQNLYKNLKEMSNNLVLNITNLEKEKSIEIELSKNKNCEEINRLKHDLTAIRNRLNKFRNPISLESARLIGLISTFLLPFCVGAHLDDILAYIRRFQISITKEDLESLMSRCWNVFKKNSDGNWVLNIYNITEPPEDEEHSKREPLEHMTHIIDSIVPPSTSIAEGNNMENIINHELNTSSDMSNCRSSPGTNLVKEMTQFLNELNASPTFQNVNLIDVPPKVSLFNKQKEKDNRLNWTNKKLLIEHVISLPLNSVWSETVKNAILLMRPKEIPLTEKYCILVKLKKTFHAIDIPPTTQEKMDSLKYFEFPSTFSEEKYNPPYNQPPEILSKRSTDNSLDSSATTSKKRRCDNDLRKIEYKNRYATGDLNVLLKIYDGFIKEGEHLCVIPSESIPCSQEFVFNIKNMFKHITIIQPLLNEIKDDDKNLTKTFSVLSVQYYDFFKNVLNTLPCFENSDISMTEEEEPKINFHEPPYVRVKVIKKHAAHAQSFLKKLKMQFEYLIEIMKVEHKMLAHYESFVANTFKYFSRLDFSLNHFAITLDKLLKNLKLKEMSISADELTKMLASVKKKNLKFETSKDTLVIIAKNITTLRSDINNIARLLDSLNNLFREIMKEDYYDHRINFNYDVIEVIEQILIHFSSELFSCESSNIIIKKKSVTKKLDILSKKSRSTSMMLKTVIKKIQQIYSPKMLEEETFNNCKDIFDFIIKYLSNLNESILAFRSPLEILMKKHANEQNINHKNIDTNEDMPINSSADRTTAREVTGKLDELHAIYRSFSGTKSFVISVEGMKQLENLYLGVKNVHKFVQILNTHLPSIREFMKDFLDEDIDKHCSILSNEYFEVIENIFKLFFSTNLNRKSSRNYATFEDVIGCANYVKEIITSLQKILKSLEADAIQLKSKYSCGRECQELFDSIHKYLLNLSQSLSIFLFAAVNVIVTNKANERKFSGSLEELYNLYKYFSENTDSSVLKDRKEISLFVLSRIGLMINLRQQFSTIRLLLDSLEVELSKRFNYAKKYKERSSMLGEEYFSIIDGFIKHFPESLVKKIEFSKIQEINFKIVDEPIEKRIDNLELQVNEAINQLNKIHLERFPWEINKFADSKDFLESFVIHLLNSLDFLQSIRFLSRYLSPSLYKQSNAYEQQLNQPTDSQLTVTDTSKQSDVSTGEHSLSHIQNQEVNLISTEEIHCDKDSINAGPNQKYSDTINTQSDTCDTEDLPEIVNGEQSASFDTEKSASVITNQINKIIPNRKHSYNLKVMHEAYQFFKNKHYIRFPTDRFDVIDNDFLRVMSDAVFCLREVHEKIIVIRGLVSVLKDDPNLQEYLYFLSEDYFIIFNEFFYGFLTKSTFDIKTNYRNAINLKLKIDESMHFYTYRKFIKRIFRLLPKLKEQFEQIRKITKKDKNIFSNCQKFFKVVFKYFQYLNDALIKFRDFFSLPINKGFFRQIYAECNEFPINSRMIENKYLVCFTDNLNAQEDLNITIEKEQSQSDSAFDEKSETACDFAKTTQKLRNELQELFEDTPDLDHHVGVDQC